MRPEQPQRQISDGAATRVDVNIGQESWLMSIVYVVLFVIRVFSHCGKKFDAC